MFDMTAQILAVENPFRIGGIILAGIAVFVFLLLVLKYGGLWLQARLSLLTLIPFGKSAFLRITIRRFRSASSDIGNHWKGVPALGTKGPTFRLRRQPG